MLTLLVVVAAAVLTPAGHWALLAFYGLLLIGLIALARLSALFLPRRLLVTLPFVLPAIFFIPFLHGGEALRAWQLAAWHLTLSRTGLELAGTILAKAWLSVLGVSLLMATTRINDLLRGLEKLRAPRLLTSLFGFTYRYLFVLNDEARRLKTGRDARFFSGKIGPGVRSAGHMAGSLFLRSYDRGERVYGAMLLRGYDGAHRSLNPLKLRPADFVFAIGLILLVVGANVARVVL
jgi:cobalt/nickel transport system permease protein